MAIGYMEILKCSQRQPCSVQYHCIVYGHTTLIMGITVLMYDTQTTVSDDHSISSFKVKVKCCLCVNVTDTGFQVFVVVSECSDFGLPVCDTM